MYHKLKNPLFFRPGRIPGYCSILSLALLLTNLSPQVPADSVKASSPTIAETINLELQQEGDNLLVLLQDFIKLMKDLFPDCEVKWNPLAGVLSANVKHHRLQATSGRRIIFLDRKARIVQQPIMVKEGRVLIPVKTVQLMLETLKVPFEIELPEKPTEPGEPDSPEITELTESPDVPESKLEPDNAPSGSIPQPEYESISGTDPAPSPETPDPLNLLKENPATSGSAFVTPNPSMEIFQLTDEPTSFSEDPGSVSPATGDFHGDPGFEPVVEAIHKADGPTKAPTVVLPSLPDIPKPVKPTGNQNLTLQPPKVLAGRIGLSWGQLADWLHRQPPRNITIIHDPETAAIADLIKDLALQSVDYFTRQVEIKDGGRSRFSVLRDIQSTDPELCIDLINMSIPADSRVSHETFRVWVVHEALWPQDTQPRDEMASDTKVYRNHQYQALALGSLIRSELGQQFPDQLISYELAPSWLLRRLNAPSAGILIPSVAGESSGEKRDSADLRIATAIHSALTAYVRGMEKVQF
jgi:hypothetical protein